MTDVAEGILADAYSSACSIESGGTLSLGMQLICPFHHVSEVAK